MRLEHKGISVEKQDFKHFEFLLQLINSSSDLTLGMDNNRKLIFVSSACEQMLCYTGKEMLGRDFDEFVDLAAQQGAAAMGRETARFSGWSGECAMARKDGKQLRVFVVIRPVEEPRSGGMGYVAQIRDITAENEQREKNETLTQDELRKLRESAEKANNAKSEFLSRMSHEMRTPLNGIIGIARMGEAAHDANKMRGYFSRIHTSSQQLLAIINDVLDLAKIESNKLSLHSVNFSFENMLRDLNAAIRPSVEEKQIVLDIICDTDIPEYLYGDEERFSQVVMNLLSNAVKFTDERGRVSLSFRLLERKDVNVRLGVSCRDDGIGMSQEGISRLFRSFEQLDGGINRKYGGTGLGLVICKNIVEMMGGTVTVSSEMGKGSTFSFDAVMAVGEQMLPEFNSGNLLKGTRVLLVDDNHETLNYIAAVLGKLEMVCDTATDGDEAIEKAVSAQENGEPYAIMLLDMNIPGMKCVEVTRHVKQMLGDGIFIIMISTTQWNDIEDEARRAGVFRFLSKPIFQSSLVDVMIEALGKLHVEEQYDKLNIDLDFSGRRVLVAEDVETNREIVAGLLNRTGVKIDTAENGAIAVEKFKASPLSYDLILIDIDMPVLDGYGATKAIRASGAPNANTVPIIALTANALKEDVEKAFNTGFNGHLAKPIDVEAMFDELSKHLLRVSSQKGANMTDENKSLSQLPDELPGMNIKEGLGRMRGNKKLFVRLLDSYFADYPFDELRTLIEQGSIADSAAKAHGIKGVSGNLGLTNIYNCALSLEGLLKSEQEKSLCILVLDKLVDAFNVAKASREALNNYDMT